MRNPRPIRANYFSIFRKSLVKPGFRIGPESIRLTRGDAVAAVTRANNVLVFRAVSGKLRQIWADWKLQNSARVVAICQSRISKELVAVLEDGTVSKFSGPV